MPVPMALLAAPCCGCSTAAEILQTSRWLQSSVSLLEKKNLCAYLIPVLTCPSTVTWAGQHEPGASSQLGYLCWMLSCAVWMCPPFNWKKREILI